MKISFASDNTTGAHPRLMQAMLDANSDYQVSYGHDDFTALAQGEFQKHFGMGAEAHFAFNGTAANVLGLSTFLRPFQSVLTAQTSHVQNDECGAVERFTGSKLVALPSIDGKLRPRDIISQLRNQGDPHHTQPRVVTITQTTECGTVYQPHEIKSIADIAHANGLILHVDGARFSNAAAALGLSLKELSADLGVDVLTFGGTKNGLAFGEAVVFFNRPETADFPFIRKQGMQLASKMRFISAQFLSLLREDIWLENARHANAMAARLHEQLRGRVEMAYPVEANALFAKLPKSVIAPLQEKFHFYVWDEDEGIVRWMTSFLTRPEDVDAFADAIKRQL